MYEKSRLKKGLDVFTTVFVVLLGVATIFSLIPFKWEPKYIVASSLQLAGIMGFSFFAIKKFLINNNFNWKRKIWKFLPILTMFFSISVMLFLLVTGNNNLTGSKKLFNAIYVTPINTPFGSLAGIKYFFVQLFLLLQMYNLKQYVLYEGGTTSEVLPPKCGWKNHYMKIFYLMFILGSIPTGLLWSEIGPLSAEG